MMLPVHGTLLQAVVMVSQMPPTKVIVVRESPSIDTHKATDYLLKGKHTSEEELEEFLKKQHCRKAKSGNPKLTRRR